MALYLGDKLISGVFTAFNTTAFDTSDANATSFDLLSGKTAYVNSNKIIGNIPTVSISTPTISVNTSGLITATLSQQSGYIPAAGTTIKTLQLSSSQDADFIATNIKTGTNIFGITGTYTSDGTLINANTLERGLIAYSKGNHFIGTGPKIFAQSAQPTSGMINGDIWIKTTTTPTLTGAYTASIASKTQTAPFTEWYNYSTYARTLSHTSSLSVSGTISSSNLTASYSIPYRLADAATYTDYAGTFYYTLAFVNSAGIATTIVSSSVSVNQNTSSTITGSTTIAATSGYFRLTTYLTLTYDNGLSTTATVSTSSATFNSAFIGGTYPPYPGLTGAYMENSYIYSTVKGWY